MRDAHAFVATRQAVKKVLGDEIFEQLEGKSEGSSGASSSQPPNVGAAAGPAPAAAAPALEADPELRPMPDEPRAARPGDTCFYCYGPRARSGEDACTLL